MANQALYDMFSVDSFVKKESRSSFDYGNLVSEIFFEHLFKVKDDGATPYQSKEVDTRGHLQVGLFVKSVKDDARARFSLYFYYHTHTETVAFVADIGYAFYLLVFRLVGYGLYKVGFVDLVWKFGYYYSFFAVYFFYFGFRTHNHAAVTGSVRFLYSRSAHYESARRIVGSGNVIHEFVNRNFGIFEQGYRTAYHFAQVVRGDTRSHTYRYTFAAVYKKVRETGGKNHRLHQRVVEVRIKVHGVFIYVAEHFAGYFTESCFGVSLSRGGVAVYGTEVALSVYERNVYREPLRKSYQRVVYRAVAVGVIFTHNFTDDTGAFLGRLVVSVT